MGTKVISEKFIETKNENSPFAILSENIWKNAPGIQALFITNSSGHILYSKFSKYFDNSNFDQINSIISSSCASFYQTTSKNPMKISISVFEKFTSMTSQIGEQFIIMIVPNNTSFGNSVQFAESLISA